jgi:hypothetical protein
MGEIMDVHITPDPCPEFKPVEIRIKISTQQELLALWHRLDVGGPYLVKRYCGGSPKIPFPDIWVETAENNQVDGSEPLFKAVDQAAMHRGLRSGGKIGH